MKLSFQVGDKVECFKGTKSGIGEVLEIETLGALVRFPDVTYPESMVIISGHYWIPREHIVRVVKDEIIEATKAVLKEHQPALDWLADK